MLTKVHHCAVHCFSGVELLVHIFSLDARRAPLVRVARMGDLALHIIQKNDSSWSMRAWLLLVQLGAPFREHAYLEHEVDFHARLRAISPTARLPLLEDGELRVWESLAIAEHLAERFPEADLWPRDPAARAWARSIAAEMHAGFGELRRQCPMNLALETRLPLDPATRRDVDRFEAIVREGRARFGAGGELLCGRFSIADAMFAPIVTRVLTYGIDVAAGTRAYVEAVRALPSVSRWYREAAEELARAPATTPPRGEQIPEGACWAVIFTSELAKDAAGYEQLAERMVALAEAQPGFLGVVSARDATLGITISYWDSLDAIAAWRADAEHARAQSSGKQRYYDRYELRVARVERRTSFARPTPRTNG